MGDEPAFEIRLLGPGDEVVLRRVADGVFDHPVRIERAVEFLTDPRHHLLVAVDASLVVGFVSAVHYVHPDKDPELWIDELAVAPSHRRRGVGRSLMKAVLSRARSLGCSEAWVLTERDNQVARALYRAAVPSREQEGVVMYSWRLDS